MVGAATWAALGTLLVTGLLGSVSHCLGMCGPLVILAGARYPKQGIASIPLHLLYHAGRVLVYTVLGAAVGALGATIQSITENARIPGMFSIAVGAAVILAGMSYLGWLPFWRRSAGSDGWWQRAVRRAMRVPGRRGIFLMGIMNGFLPCGLVYESLLVAAATRSPLIGALGMLVFGAATIPALTVLGAGAALLSIPARRALAWAGGAFMILVGIGLVLRGMAGLGVFPQML